MGFSVCVLGLGQWWPLFRARPAAARSRVRHRVLPAAAANVLAAATSYSSRVRADQAVRPRVVTARRAEVVKSSETRSF
jgi:hypothetical protein